MHSSPETEATRAIEGYMRALNNRDDSHLLDLLHLPHIRISGAGVKIYTSRKQLEEEYLAEFYERAGTEWDHTDLDSVEVLHISEQKVHLFIQWTRRRKDETAITTQQALWVMTEIDGIWGAQARSSFAPA